MNKKLIFTLVAASLSTSALAEGVNLNLSPVVVTATRSPQNSFDLPVSIDSVGSDTIQDGRMQFSIAESLSRVPGIVASARGQSAQDVQISSRGFGARSAFGVRGVRLYADGIPLTMPDGQGQAGTFDLSSAKSIEVMRGPFSALHGWAGRFLLVVRIHLGRRQHAATCLCRLRRVLRGDGNSAHGSHDCRKRPRLEEMAPVQVRSGGCFVAHVEGPECARTDPHCQADAFHIVPTSPQRMPHDLGAMLTRHAPALRKDIHRGPKPSLRAGFPIPGSTTRPLTEALFGTC